MPLDITQRTLTAPAFEVAAFGQNPGGSGAIHIGPDGHPVPPDTTPTDFQANVSPATDCWRLVHDGSTVLDLFQSPGVTMTRQNLFCGTLDECNAEITAQGLDRTAYDARQAALNPPSRQRPRPTPPLPSPVSKTT